MVIINIRKEVKNTEEKFIKLTSDVTFKYLFSNEKTRPWFEDIIKHLCNVDLSGYEFVDKEITSGNHKDYILDNLLKDRENSYVIVEMQNYEADDKNYGYLFRVAGNHLKKKDTYTSNVTLIQFKDYIPHDVKDNRIILEFELREKYNHEMKRSGIISYEIILPNILKKDYNKLNKYEKKLILFKCKDYKEMFENIKDKNDEVLVKELRMLAMDDNFDLYYSKEKADELIARENERSGYRKGIEDNKKQAAIEFYNNGASKELIIKSLHITSEKLEEYLNNKNAN